MKDRYTRGFVSGVIASVPAMLANQISYSLGYTSLTWLQIASILIYGNKPANIPETIFGGLMVIFFTGLVGSVFAFIIIRISSEYNLFKSWMYGVTIWFVIFAVATLFKVSDLMLINLNTAVVTFLSASIWGVTLGYVLKWLDARAKIR